LTSVVFESFLIYRTVDVTCRMLTFLRCVFHFHTVSTLYTLVRQIYRFEFPKPLSDCRLGLKNPILFGGVTTRSLSSDFDLCIYIRYCSRGVSLPVRHEGYVIHNHMNQIKFSSTNLLCSYYRKGRV